MKFGDRVKVKAVLRRECSPYDEHRGLYKNEWKPQELTEIRNGIYLGKRRLIDGTVSYSNEGAIFKAEKYVRVALVCLSEKENPIYVRPEDVEK